MTGNVIAEIDDGAFASLHNLEELILAENRLTKLPMLPTNLVLFNANFNKLKTSGVKATAFKVSLKGNPSMLECVGRHFSFFIALIRQAAHKLSIFPSRNSQNWCIFILVTMN